MSMNLNKSIQQNEKEARAKCEKALKSLNSFINCSFLKGLYEYFLTERKFEYIVLSEDFLACA